MASSVRKAAVAAASSTPSSALDTSTASSGSNVLTTLCSICRSEVPKYKCPRCASRTCSLACAKRHKAWSGCDGRRDPTVYLPNAKLRTPAGFDHDYNFITGIEIATARAERDIIEERRLLTVRDVRPHRAEADRRFRREWHGDELRHVPIPADQQYQLHDHRHRFHKQNQPQLVLEKHIRRSLRALDIEVREAPKGLQRQRENTTAWNRRLRCVNWMVEWLVYGDVLPSPDGTTPAAGAPTRILRKIVDEEQLYKGFAGAMEWYRHGEELKAQQQGFGNRGEEEGPPRKKQRKSGSRQDVVTPQDVRDGRWGADTWHAVQNPFTGTWARENTPMATSWDRDAAVEEKKGRRYFLLNVEASGPSQKVLTPVESTETLAQVLPGRTVIEFPTIYVLPLLKNGELPDGHILGPPERRARPEVEERDGLDSDDGRHPNNRHNGKGQRAQGSQPNGKGQKRKWNQQQGTDQMPPHKKQAVGSGGHAEAGGMEKGEATHESVARVGRQDGEESPTSSEGSTSSDDSDSDVESIGLEQVAETVKAEVPSPRERTSAKVGGGLVDYDSDSSS